MIVFHTYTIQVDNMHELYDYSVECGKNANNLYNKTLFIQRQVMTYVKKDSYKWSENEMDVMEKIRRLINAKGFNAPTEKKWLIGFEKMSNLMVLTQDNDYYAKGFPKQTAERVIKQMYSDFSSYFENLRKYKRDPSSYTGIPKLPHYKTKGSIGEFEFSNQSAKVRYDEKNHIWYSILPGRRRINLGKKKPDGKLDKVSVSFSNGTFTYGFVFAVEIADPVFQETPKRIASIDLGVNNLMAVTNNIGVPCVLYKGGVVKSINQQFNKYVAAEMSNETIGSNEKFVPTEKFEKICKKRNNAILDYFHKLTNHFTAWCVDNRIDTVVIGCNKGWKQEVSMGSIYNQNFVMIPFYKLKKLLSYKLYEKGINFIDQEESYTSLASFVDGDKIPVYNANEQKTYQFSGKRGPTEYKGHKKPSGYRGLYESSNGTIVNSDLNGSANILRKRFPNAFKEGATPNFANITVIVVPYFESIITNTERQKNASLIKGISNSKKRRLNRKNCK